LSLEDAQRKNEAWRQSWQSYNEARPPWHRCPKRSFAPAVLRRASATESSSIAPRAGAW